MKNFLNRLSTLHLRLVSNFYIVIDPCTTLDDSCSTVSRYNVVSPNVIQQSCLLQVFNFTSFSGALEAIYNGLIWRRFQQTDSRINGFNTEICLYPVFIKLDNGHQHCVDLFFKKSHFASENRVQESHPEEVFSKRCRQVSRP
ncbi:hypothetical protein JTE90_003131 [Oedothorax gibbosus]|uniref:Uncharacterized protein n=1 Tax=Oedothorax gibbosus TaxID=931172 RepID=A0AAV6VER0_9ARAC|nr:hypothetical protein JTE90_003131 [Oedothorax gibbosus]